MSSEDIKDWQTTCLTFQQKTSHLLKTGLWSDYKVTVTTNSEKQDFKVHKLILSMSSPVFAAMIQGDFINSKNEVVISDVQPKIFHDFLRYIYEEGVDIHSLEQASELYYVAKKYMVPSLIQECSKFICDKIDVSNVFQAYQFADLLDDHSVIQKCKEFIKSHIMEVLEQPSFLEINLKLMDELLGDRHLGLDEVSIYKYFMLWSEQEIKRRGITNDLEAQRKLLLPLLKKIRMLSFTPAEFSEGPCLNPLLTESEKLAILMNISSSKQCAVSLPDGFCTFKYPRGCDRIELLSQISKRIYTDTRFSSAVFEFCFRIQFADMNLLGIKIRGQKKLVTTSSKTYHENFRVIVSQIGLDLSEPLHDEVFNPFTKWGENEEVVFHNPVYIKKAVSYSITVILNCRGCYFINVYKDGSHPIENSYLKRTYSEKDLFVEIFQRDDKGTAIEEILLGACIS